jgi:hypothetical protein
MLLKWSMSTTSSESSPRTGAAGQVGGERAVEVAPVVQPGQRVADGLLGELGPQPLDDLDLVGELPVEPLDGGLALLLLADVADDEDAAQRPAARVADGGVADVEPQPRDDLGEAVAVPGSPPA